ncbi:MAG: hypothetical protein IPM13_06625 [Phycisphaerales bacterium]|nr:hypothetical protein [Phycisphaerales bacterium]
MSAAPATFGICPRCARPLRSRGGSPPRYCAVCGQRVGADEFVHVPPRPSGGAEGRPNVEHRFSHASSVEHRFVEPGTDWVGAISMVAACLGLFPFCGFPFAVAAVALGVAAQVGTRRRPSRVALGGTMIGALGVFMHLSCWGAFR